MGSWCLKAAHSYKGPLIAIGIGVGFMVVGAVPVAVTFAMNSRGSATIIGVGFIGFGLLVVLPGICWCVVRRVTSFRCCQSKQERLHLDDEYSPDEDMSSVNQQKSSSLTAKACYVMADDRCHVEHIGESLNVVDDADDEIQPDDGNVRLTR